MKVMRLKETYPTAKVELWCEDEQRLGLKLVPERQNSSALPSLVHPRNGFECREDQQVGKVSATREASA
jgi:hypothetical protein